jgi:lipoprotein NlpD
MFLINLAGCGSRTDLAPVLESNSRPFSRTQGTHVVRSGETLYAIAFGYDTDYRQLARLNHLNPPYKLRVGQVLNVRGLGRRNVIKHRPNQRPVYTARKPKAQTARTPIFSSHFVSGWQWPVKGRVVTSFIPEQGKKGINIASNKGEKVHAALSGVVAYAGSGLAGYGNLIIIKHNNQYLTAYGNSVRNLVSEGQQVKAGQIIAEVGIIDRAYWGVHFEIRKMGVPVNPLNYLKQ